MSIDRKITAGDTVIFITKKKRDEEKSMSLLNNDTFRTFLFDFILKHPHHFINSWKNHPDSCFFVMYTTKDNIANETFVAEKYFNDNLKKHSFDGEMKRVDKKLYFKYNAFPNNKHMPILIFKLENETIALLLLPMYITLE